MNILTHHYDADIAGASLRLYDSCNGYSFVLGKKRKKGLLTRDKSKSANGAIKRTEMYVRTDFAIKSSVSQYVYIYKINNYYVIQESRKTVFYKTKNLPDAERMLSFIDKIVPKVGVDNLKYIASIIGMRSSTDEVSSHVQKNKQMERVYARINNELSKLSGTEIIAEFGKTLPPNLKIVRFDDFFKSLKIPELEGVRLNGTSSLRVRKRDVCCEYPWVLTSVLRGRRVLRFGEKEEDLQCMIDIVNDMHAIFGREYLRELLRVIFEVGYPNAIKVKMIESHNNELMEIALNLKEKMLGDIK